jgi:hypothetical protein
MSDLRLLISVNLPRGQSFPEDDTPFWQAIDAMADAVAASARARGLDPNEFEAMRESDEGSMLTISSDAPRDVLYCWIYLPRDGAVQSQLLPVLLAHLSDARAALPDADWDVSLGPPLAWDGERFRLRS